LVSCTEESARGKVKDGVKDKIFAAPTYRTLSCPEKFLDCRAVPGEGHPWKQLSWEETQSVTVLTRNAPDGKCNCTMPRK
jgi:hypothetical protein